MMSWRVILRPESGFLIGGIGEPPRGVHAASGFVHDPTSGSVEAVLPGTSIKGVLRDAFRRFGTVRTGSSCSGEADCRCPACRVFGTAEKPGKLAVRSALVPAERHDRSRVAIERSTRTSARAGRALWSEQRAWTSNVIDLTLAATDELEPEEAQLLETFWAWLGAVGLSVGKGKSTGGGYLTIQSVDRFEPAADRLPSTVRGDGPAVPYRILIELLEPTRLVGLRQREFFRDALDAIPAATVRGALGWALVRSGREDLATDLFRSPAQVRVATAYPVETGLPESAAEEPIPWLSVALCRGDPRHRVNLAPLKVAARLGATVSSSPTCPTCRADLEAVEAPSPPTIVIGRTAIEAGTGRVALGMLYYEVAVAPGARFVAQMLARPDQAEALAALGEVWVGGRKRSGQGRARITVEPVELEPLSRRLEGTRATLARLGVDARQIAFLGLLGDAALENPLRAELEARGLQVVAGELRSTIRGGWDEERNAPRPVREVIRGGSWIAVEVPPSVDEAVLERLEAEGIPDPMGIEPALFRVRSDWEVVELSDPETPARPSAEAVDVQIKEVRDLCRRHASALPERSQLQTLLRFAQSTDSPEELRLFIQYQASRDQFRRFKAFLTELVAKLEKRFSDDIIGARRYLGWVVRAGNVERLRAAQDQGRAPRDR